MIIKRTLMNSPGSFYYLQESIRDLGFSHIVVNSRETAVGFYQKLGFTVTDPTPIQGDTFRCIRMEKEF